MRTYTIFQKSIVWILSLFMLAALLFGVACPAIAETSTYSDVLADLKLDPEFDESIYPESSKDTSLNVITIAESTGGELFVYVHQPCAATKILTATEIRISQFVGDNLSPVDYSLKLLNQNGVFQKYKVEGITIFKDQVRYYEIIQIVRPWDESIGDKASSTDDTTSTVPFEVSKRFTACTIDDAITYSCIDTETIEITDKDHDFISYSNGFKFWYNDSCNSHYVMFNTNRPIDALYEADLTYSYQSYSKHYLFAVINWEDKGEIKSSGEITLTSDEFGENKADGLFVEKHTWPRIESVSSFLDNESDYLSNEAKDKVKNYSWILRFAETDYNKSPVINGVSHENGIYVSDVTVLRLKFSYEGDTYNLGVIDNKQTDDGNPDGGTGLDLESFLETILYCFAGLIGIIALGFIVSIIPWPIVWDFIKLVLKGIVWIITLPFKAIGALFSKKDKQDGQKK